MEVIKNNILKLDYKKVINIILISFGFNFLLNSHSFSYLINLFSLPIFILFFKKFDIKLSKKAGVIAFLIIYLMSLFIDYNFSVIFFILGSISFMYLMESNSYLLKLLLLTIIVLSFAQMSLFILIAFFINILIILINKRKYIKTNDLKDLLFIAVILTSIVVYLPNLNIVNDLKENINSIMLNFKDNLDFNGIILGKYKNSDVDILNIIYQIGIVGVLNLIVIYIYLFKKVKFRNYEKGMYLMLLVLSFLTRDVLNNFLVSISLAIIYISKNSNHKNILLVSNMYPSIQYMHYGIFVKNTYDLLKENNYTVDLVVMTKQEEFASKLMAYINLFVVSFIKSIINNYDYIYVHFVSHSSVGVLIPYLFSKNTKLVLNVHGNDIVFDTKQDKKNEFMSRIALNLADIVISPSNYFKGVLLRNYRVNLEKIVVYPSGGIDIYKFKNMDKLEAKKRLNLDAKKNYLGFVSRIEKDKGYDTLIIALSELNKHNFLNNIKVIIVGSGNEDNMLNDLIKKYQLDKHIIRRPLVNQEELVLIYNSIDALIYPTRRKSESLGLIGLEALSCETLVIGSNKYGPSDYLNDLNSLTIDPNDYSDLVEKIKLALNMDKEKKDKLIKNGQKTVLNYSLDNTKNIILNVFKN